jgi:hypothetical protein
MEWMTDTRPIRVKVKGVGSKDFSDVRSAAFASYVRVSGPEKARVLSGHV